MRCPLYGVVPGGVAGGSRARTCADRRRVRAGQRPHREKPITLVYA